MSDSCVNVLFVCMGNICRSPTAECLFRSAVKERGIADKFHVDSAGTVGWNTGSEPDRRMRSAARKIGKVIRGSARQITTDDFSQFDWLFCMDQDNYDDLIGMGADAKKTKLLLPFVKHLELREVPDPCYGGDSGFDQVLTLIDDAVQRLVDILA